MILALALGWKIGLSILIGCVGVILAILIRSFDASDINVAGTGSIWVVVLIGTAVAIFALCFAGCAVEQIAAVVTAPILMYDEAKARPDTHCER